MTPVLPTSAPRLIDAMARQFVTLTTSVATDSPYRDDPVGFARDVLGHDPWAMPEQIMAALTKPRARVAVKACHSSAKTFTAAEVVLWWIFAVGGQCITTAPTWFQVEKLLWAEVRSMLARVGERQGSRHTFAGVPYVPLQTELKVSEKNFAVGLSTNDGVRFQGFHASPGFPVLLILDEAPGVRPDIYEAIEGIRAGGDVRVLALGNPTIASGPFYDAYNRDRAAWRTFTIDALDTPNLHGVTLDELRAIPLDQPDEAVLSVSPRPYLTTRRWVWEKLHTWGEDSPMWQSRVRGQFPDQAEDALIALSKVEAAMLPRHQPHPGLPDDEPVYGGLDVAGPGDDETVLYLRTASGVVAPPLVWTSPDPRGEVLAALSPYRGRLVNVNVDTIGIGYYLARHLEDDGLPVTHINVGTAPWSKDPDITYLNLKAELYWALRGRFVDGAVTGITDDTTVGQLTGIRYAHDARGRIVIESKEQARKRGVRSPDRAEALMLAFAEPPVIPDPPMFEPFTVTGTSTWDTMG